MDAVELAGVVLEHLNSLHPRDGQQNRYNFSLPSTVQGYPPQHREEISRALMHGWMWLERELLILPRPGAGGDWIDITPKARQFAPRISASVDIATAVAGAAQEEHRGLCPGPGHRWGAPAGGAELRAHGGRTSGAA